MSEPIQGGLNKRVGTFVLKKIPGESFRAFIPPPLPPDPPLDQERLAPYLHQAATSVGRLDGISAILPDPHLFVAAYIQKEALVSSQIEGTQSSFSDLLLFDIEETPNVPMADVKEVSNYVAALTHGLDRMRNGFPLSLRLLREMHGILLRSGRGEGKQPGEFRTSQNWIGGTRPGDALYVPPPVEELTGCLNQFEAFLHHPMANANPLLHAALSHVQFESIHPFLDGNGRLGRALITLLFCGAGLLHEPVLYLSLYFKRHRARYYELLQSVRMSGNWEDWCVFFLEGAAETAAQAVDTARRILKLLEEDRRMIESLPAAPTGLRFHAYLARQPITSAVHASKQLGLSFPTAQAALARFEQAGLIREITGRSRGRLYMYTKYLAILDEGTEPLKLSA